VTLTVGWGEKRIIEWAVSYPERWGGFRKKSDWSIAGGGEMKWGGKQTRHVDLTGNAVVQDCRGCGRQGEKERRAKKGGPFGLSICCVGGLVVLVLFWFCGGKPQATPRTHPRNKKDSNTIFFFSGLVWGGGGVVCVCFVGRLWVGGWDFGRKARWSDCFRVCISEKIPLTWAWLDYLGGSPGERE